MNASLVRIAVWSLLMVGLLTGGASILYSESSSGRKAMCSDSVKDKLSDMQYHVTCNNGTEPPFMNEYWNNKKPGLYVDIISGEPLFLSTDKFDSGTGWPSFTKPVNEEEVVEVKDTTHGMVRVEVRSKTSDAHLGHVFTDGPKPTGMRYCINSASLKFIPLEKMESEGFGRFLKHFQK